MDAVLVDGLVDVLVAGLAEATEDVVGAVVAAVVPLVAGGLDEQAAAQSPVRPKVMAAASAVRGVCVGMRHLRGRR